MFIFFYFYDRLAIILCKAESYCENPPYNQLKGLELLRQRHLEILGHKVVYINYKEWNSMYLSLPGARIQYLKKLLGIS